MQTAEKIILKAGLRPTNARLAVLETIAEASCALSHAEIVEHLGQKGVDRVTIYRVLDWLTEHQLIHRISGENRAWKFRLSQSRYQRVPVLNQANVLTQNHQHAHLHCKVCGQITCIHELEPHFPNTVLAQYQVDSIDINIKGVCLQCAALTPAK